MTAGHAPRDARRMATTTVLQRARSETTTDSRVSTADLVRLSGVALVLAGILMAFFPILHPNHDPAGFANPIWVPVHLMPATSMILAILGLCGLLARQLTAAGRLGVVGFALAVVGSGMILMGSDVEAFIIPFVGLHAPELMQGPPPAGWMEAEMLGDLIFGIGYLMLGIATFRAGALPRAAGALLAVGGLGVAFGAAVSQFVAQPLLLGALLFGLAQVWIGYALWSDPGAGHAR